MTQEERKDRRNASARRHGKQRQVSKAVPPQKAQVDEKDWSQCFMGQQMAIANKNV